MDKILVLGAKGMLGQHLVKILPGAVGWDREDLDVTDSVAAAVNLGELKPSAVVNCVAYNDVDGAEQNKVLAKQLNTQVPGELAKITAKLKIPFVHFSTNYVFGGERGGYRETDEPKPLSVYGQSKAEGEKLVLESNPQAYIVRTAVLFGPKGQSAKSKKSFVELMLEKSVSKQPLNLVSDEINSLTYVFDLAAAVKSLLDDKNSPGIYHITNSGQASWYELAQEIFRILGLEVSLNPVSGQSLPRPARRPKRAVLLNTKLPELRPWQEALKEFLISNF